MTIRFIISCLIFETSISWSLTRFFYLALKFNNLSESILLPALMKRRSGSRGVIARDRPPGKLRHASHNIQVATRCLRTLLAEPSSYSKIFAAPPDFFNSIFFFRQHSFRTRVVCFATMWDFLSLTCRLCRRRAVSVDSDKLAGLRMNLIFQNENKFTHVRISMRLVFVDFHHRCWRFGSSK